METSDYLTVIVATRNDACNIEAFLRSLPPHVGLIIVDNSDDETRELVAAIRPANTRLMWLPTTLLEARQIGAESARTEWLLFTDAAITFAADYFSLLPSQLTADALYGVKLSRDDAREDDRWFLRGQAALGRLGIPAAPGSNLLVRREVFHAIGGFDLALNNHEDMEVVWRVRRNGYRLRFAPELVVFVDLPHRPDQTQTRNTWRSLAHSALRYSGLWPGQWPQKVRAD